MYGIYPVGKVPDNISMPLLSVPFTLSTYQLLIVFVFKACVFQRPTRVILAYCPLYVFRKLHYFQIVKFFVIVLATVISLHLNEDSNQQGRLYFSPIIYYFILILQGSNWHEAPILGANLSNVVIDPSNRYQ